MKYELMGKSIFGCNNHYTETDYLGAAQDTIADQIVEKIDDKITEKT